MTKLRFIKQSNFGIKNYINDKEGVSLLKLKSNMTDMKANYKANHNNSLCRRCGTQEEKIEHMWDCPEFSNECTTTANCYMDKNDAKTFIKINRDVEKFLDYPY